MLELTLDQIERVEDIVSRSEITYSHLPDDLVDHICCDVESEMSVGLSFKEAFERVQQKFGDFGLQKIQEDTIVLIDQKYKFMKTTMKIFGNVSLAMLGIATLFKIMHWPGAGILLTLGFVFLAFIFFPATIIASYRKSEKKRPVLYALIIIGGIAFMLGVLFKIQHWPGAGIMLTGGWGFLLIFFLPAWLIVKLNDTGTKGNRTIYLVGVIGVIIFGLSNLFKIQHWPGAAMMTMIGAILIISVFLPMFSLQSMKKSELVSGRFIYLIILGSLILILVSLLNINLSRGIFGSTEKTTSAIPFTSKYNYLERDYYQSKNVPFYNQLKEYTIGNQNKINLVRNKADDLCKSIQEVQKKMILEIPPGFDNEYDSLINHIYHIANLFDSREVTHYMIGVNNNGFAYKLKAELKDYKALIANNFNGNPEINKQLDCLFPLKDVVVSDEIRTWEDRSFKYALLINALMQLSHIERNIRTAEQLCIRELQKKHTIMQASLSETNKKAL